MKYTIANVEFLNINEVNKLTLLKDKIKKYFIKNTEWEFFKLPCLYSKSTITAFLSPEEKDEIISIHPPTKKNIEYYLNSEKLIGSFIESQDGVMFSYKEIPKKFILDTILTGFDKKTGSFYSDYNNLVFACLIKSTESSAVVISIKKELRKCLLSFIKPSVLALIKIKRLSLEKVLKCRNKDNSILPLDMIFYTLLEKDILANQFK